jgi:PKD repeat protein
LYLNNPSCVSSAIAPIASFSTSPLCVYTPVNFVDQSSNHPDTWNWNIQVAVPTNSLYPNPIYTFSTTGNYTATLITSNTNGSDTMQLTFYISSLPTIITSSTRTVLCRWENVGIRAYGGVSYTWNTAQTGSLITVSPYTTTICTVTGTDSIGCASQATHLLNVVSDCWTSVPSINFENTCIVIALHPSSGKFFISTSEELIDEYSVYNLCAS